MLTVVLYHGFANVEAPSSRQGIIGRALLTITSNGFLGVELFFVLSGFLITGILIQGKQESQSLRDFYRRRALRLLPAFVVILGVIMVFRVAEPATVVASALFLANLLPLLGLPFGGYGVLWSLAVEEHFYLIWPSVVHRVRSSSVVACAASIIVIEPLVRAICFGHVSREAFLYYTWFKLDGLALGALVAYVVRSTVTRRQLGWIASTGIIGSLAVLIVGAPFGITSRYTRLGAALFITVTDAFFASLVVAVLLVGTSRLRRLVQIRVLQFFGLISYGLYLVHTLCLDLAGWILRRFWSHDFDPGTLGAPASVSTLIVFGLAFALATAVASVSRFTFESYFLRLGRGTAPTEEAS